MIFEILGILCICYTGYSGYQTIKAPFSYFSQSAHVVETPHKAIITTASSGQNPATNINNNQNSAGLFAVNYSDGSTPSLLGYIPIIFCTSAGVGYVAKTKVMIAVQLLHNHTTWTYWVLKNFKKDVSGQETFEQELQHRCPGDEDKTALHMHIRKQIDAELNCLKWFCRITSIAKKLYIAWLFEIQEEDIILAQQAITHLSTIRNLPA